MSRCRCDGRYRDCTHGPERCSNIPGTPWGPYFCSICDSRRLVHIAQNLEELRCMKPSTTGP